jgi:hypothetical protein
VSFDISTVNIKVNSVSKGIMNQDIYISHADFIEGYKSQKYFVYVDENKAGDFVLSDHANPHNKPAHNFWSWTGLILAIIAPIILLFINWPLAIISVILGFTIISAARKSACQFVIENMVEVEDFWNYVLLHQGARIVDKEGNNIKSSFLNKMENKVLDQ